ncbi:unnamed protein product [Darwinula stevensoni]|uniref:Small lysine-rich protein 1 n=1 Tax=Darwinula stevensoni TaxID=69355 RepID=A0A7R8X285_9CRUS|nr:unnamed protein product [Darwinula stevensoni]CAG0881149.1 unnamed protein product [Darwinula stevensoni]
MPVKGKKGHGGPSPSSEPKKPKTSVRSRQVQQKNAAGSSNKKSKKTKSKPTASKKGHAEGKAKADILGPIAMENAYYTCHNVPDLLLNRGFPWPATAKSKKGKKRRRK